MNSNIPDSMALLRVHLQDKSAGELITLLLDLIQQVDEPTRQQFWNRLIVFEKSGQIQMIAGYPLREIRRYIRRVMRRK